jgi:hypothetical protein
VTIPRGRELSFLSLGYEGKEGSLVVDELSAAWSWTLKSGPGLDRRLGRGEGERILCILPTCKMTAIAPNITPLSFSAPERDTIGFREWQCEGDLLYETHPTMSGTRPVYAHMPTGVKRC